MQRRPSGGEIDRLRDELFGERLPPVDLAHADLAGSEQRPEQHGGGVGGRQHGLRLDPSLELLVQPLDRIGGAHAARTVFARFNELGSVRRVWLWMRSEGLSLPLQSHYGSSIRWVDPSYIAIYQVLTNPVYAGAYRRLVWTE